MINDNYWVLLERLIESNGLTIDRPKGSIHPKYKSFIYPVDYGYINNTSSQDGSGIDIWIGTDTLNTVVGIICSVDSIKMDSEIKVLYNCTSDEIDLIYNIHNGYPTMQGLLIHR